MTSLLVPFHQDERLPEDSIRLPDGQDVVLLDPTLTSAGIWNRLVELYRVVADVVAEKVTARAADEPCPSVVSGDCLTALATLTGVQRAGHPDAAIVWFDAHGDVHTVDSSTSGYLGGMALRMAVGGDPDRLTGPLGTHPLRDDQAVLVDARDLDPAEAQFLAAGRLRRIPVSEVAPDLLGAAPLVVHIDVDVINADELPGLRFPVPGGPGADAVIAAVHRLLDSGRVVALDIACPWYPASTAKDADIRALLLSALLRR